MRVSATGLTFLDGWRASLRWRVSCSCLSITETSCRGPISRRRPVSRRVVEAARDGNRVVEAGNDDERADGVGQVVEEKADVLVGVSGAVDREENQGNLKKCSGLAEKTWRERPITLNNQDDGGHNQQQNIAADHQNRDPPADFLGHCQHYEGRTEQQLVSNGVEIRAEG